MPRVQGLLALDVDGTLLTSRGVLSPRTRRALHSADRAGWHVALITGRLLPHVLPLARELGIGRYVVAANGSSVAEVNGSVLYQATIPSSLVATALTLVRRELPEIRLAVTTGRGFHTEEGFDVLAPLSREDATLVEDATPGAEDIVSSVILFTLGVETAWLLGRVAAVVPADLHVSPSGLPGSVELTAPGVHKGSGVAYLCELLSIDRRNVVAFGDGMNDHEMLRWAGRSIAMGNADALTKAIADEVTATNDQDGVAAVIEQMLAG